MLKLILKMTRKFCYMEEIEEGNVENGKCYGTYDDGCLSEYCSVCPYLKSKHD